MPTMKFTQAAVAKLKAPDPSGKQRLYWDGELKGLGLLISGATDSKSYVVQHRLKDGRDRRVTLGAANVLSVEEARNRARAVLADIYAGQDPKAALAKRRQVEMTLRGALDAYLSANRKLAPKSQRTYRAMVERHLSGWLDKKLRDITADMVEAEHARIKDAIEREAAKVKAKLGRASRSGGGEVSGAATANATMRALRALYNFAAERDPSLPANPTRRLKRQWYPVERRERLIKADELPGFYKALMELPNPISRDYLLLLLFSGLRRAECAALRWEHIDFAGRMIRLPAAATKAHRKLDLPMSAFVRDLLVARRAFGNDDGWVFPSDSRSGHIEEPRSPLEQIAKATGIKVVPHDLRRTYATIADSCDLSSAALKGLLNHSAGNDVTSGYVRLSSERLREAAQKVCDKLTALCGIEAPAGANISRIG